MEFLIIIGWIILSFVIADLGKSKTIGYGATLAICLFLSPIIGILVVIASSDKKITLRQDPRANKLISKAQKMKSKDIDESLKLMSGALYADPKNPHINFLIGGLYSLKKQKEESYKYLNKAVDLKYRYINNVKSSHDYEWLRSQSDFNEFVLNGFKLPETIHTEFVPQQLGYIAELKELAQLKDDGILTEDEFKIKKEEILASNQK